jgi:hypothetical protein
MHSPCRTLHAQGTNPALHSVQHQVLYTLSHDATAMPTVCMFYHPILSQYTPH